MKTCANCGHTMNDQDVFCSNCGAMSLENTDSPAATPQPAAASTPEVTPAPAPAAPKGGTKGIGKVAILAAVAVVVLVVAVFGITGALKGGDDSFAGVQREFLLDSGVTYVEQLVDQYNAMTNLSTDMTVKVETGVPEYDAYLDGTALRMGLETQRDAFALDATLQLMGSDVLHGVVALDDGMLTLAMPEINDNRYVLDLKQIIYENTGIEVTELALPELSKDTMVSLLKSYFEVVIATATDDNVTVEKNQEIELPYLGETVKGTRYVFQPTAKDVENMMLRLADALEQDEDLREFILSLAGNNLALVGQMLNVEDLDATLQQSLDEAAASLRASAAKIGQEAADAGFTWTVGYADGRVCYQGLGLAGEPDTYVYESAGKESQGRRDVIYINDGYSEDGPSMVIEAEYTKDGGAYSGTVTIKEWGETVLSAEYQDVNPEKCSPLGTAYGSYVFTVRDYDTEMTVEMTVEKSASGGTDIVMTFTGDDFYSMTGFDGLTLRLYSTDKDATIQMPEGDEVDIASMSDDELMELSMLIQSSLMESLSAVLSMSY